MTTAAIDVAARRTAPAASDTLRAVATRRRLQDVEACLTEGPWPYGAARADAVIAKFAAVDLTMPAAVLRQIEDVVGALAELVALPAYRKACLGGSPDDRPRPAGIFTALDFHVTPDGPRLIEANTNGGGAFLLGLMGEALGHWSRPVWQERLAIPIMAEWQKCRTGQALRRIAIVDDHPQDQFLYDEFLLAARALQHLGVETLILDPQELVLRDGRLHHGLRAIDLVYNRTTRFSLDGPADAALKTACQTGAAVVTPNPCAHALWAQKSNLAIWSDEGALRDLGLSPGNIRLLSQAVPKTQAVTPQTADALWRRRDELYFKPRDGHASKGVYAGDKLTHRTWDAICAGSYVAQERCDPPRVDTPAGTLKADLRAFVWDGRIIALGGRLFRGQTMNFRTAGGGFAHVAIV
jgi:hypothetical protein